VIRVSLQGQLESTPRWLELARTADAGGFDALYVGDHPGTSPAPFVALAAAATVTERIRLGTCVLNAGRWEPLALASEVATLDVLSDGRALLGIGAGHTPAEWLMAGLEIPRPGLRVARLTEVAEAVRLLLTGDEISLSGVHLDLKKAVLKQPRPIQDPIPLMIGGNGRNLLRFAATAADIVGVTGLGTLLGDGHSHEVDWRATTLDSTFDLIRLAAGTTGRTPSIEALVQHVEFTDDAEAHAHEIAKVIPGASGGDILASPFVWIGTPEEIALQLHEFEERWGVTRYVVREAALTQATEMLRLLNVEG
jgi:probable F420-dependent oxidoreductase